MSTDGSADSEVNKLGLFVTAWCDHATAIWSRQRGSSAQALCLGVREVTITNPYADISLTEIEEEAASNCTLCNHKEDVKFDYAFSHLDVGSSVEPNDELWSKTVDGDGLQITRPGGATPSWAADTTGRRLLVDMVEYHACLDKLPHQLSWMQVTDSTDAAAEGSSRLLPVGKIYLGDALVYQCKWKISKPTAEDEDTLTQTFFRIGEDEDEPIEKDWSRGDTISGDLGAQRVLGQEECDAVARAIELQGPEMEE